MAKDRNRHARVRDSRQEPQDDMVTLEIGKAFAAISEDVAMAIAGFADFADTVMGCVERLLEAQNGER